MTVAAPPINTTKIELFREGNHRDSLGNAQAWSPETLQEMADAYNSIAGSNHDAPILIGHDGNTAYGWLAKAYVEGGKLLGEYKEVDPTFAEYANAGRYKKRSISIYPPSHPANPTPGKYNIRHVAYVGVPAIKGMADHKFEGGSEEGAIVYEFGEAAEVVEPSVLDLQKQLGEVVSQFQEFKEMMQDKEMTMEELQTENKTLKDEVSALKAEIANANKAKQYAEEHSQVVSFVEGLIRDNKVLPAERDEVIENAMLRNGADEVEFSEGGVTTKATQRQKYLQTLSKRAAQWSNKDMPTSAAHAPANFSESQQKSDRLYPTANFSEESNKQEQAVFAYMTEKSCSYAEAVEALARAGQLS